MQRADYVQNSAQKRLAEEITLIVHGDEGLKQALRITEAAKPGSHTLLDKATLEALATEIPSKNFAASAVVGQKLIDLFVNCEMLASKGEARRMLASGGIYVNNEKITDEHFVISDKNLVEGQFLY